MKVPRAYRLDEGLVERFEARARELGQSYTVFVERALEKALAASGVSLEPEVPAGRARSGSAPSRAPDEEVPLPKIAPRRWAR